MVSGEVDGSGRLRRLVGISGGVYLSWWFMVELLLPGSFNPLPGRLIVVALSGLIVLASFRSQWVERHLSSLFTAWASLLVLHYGYLLVGNHGDATWWIGAFVTFAAIGMCLQSRREVAVFSVLALATVVAIAASLDSFFSRSTCPGSRPSSCSRTSPSGARPSRSMQRTRPVVRAKSPDSPVRGGNCRIFSARGLALSCLMAQVSPASGDSKSK